MLTIEDLKDLAAISGPCLSVMEPLRDVTGQVSLAETRLTTAAQQADALLLEKRYTSEAREEFLRPILKLAKNTDWAGRSGSFIVFRGPGLTKASFWSAALEPCVRLADQFFVLPLLEGLEGNNFWILALNPKKVHLYRGNLNEIAEVPLPPGTPLSLTDAGGFDQPDHDLEGRSAPGIATGQSSIRFGTSAEVETKWRHMRDFFHIIERSIRPMLAQTGDPLILAAVDREQVIYRDVNTYGPLLEQAIHGSPDSLGIERLHASAIGLLSAESQQAAEKMRRDMDSAAGAKLLITDLKEILKAARTGQVQKLFVGRVDRNEEELLNSAVLAVIRNSGSVISKSAKGRDGAAAILRYRAMPPVTDTREFAGTRAEP